MTAQDAAARAYTALLRLYPRQFREQHRSDMAQLFRDQCRDESTWRVSARTVLDLTLSLPTQHLEARMHSTSTPLVPLLFAAVATGGLLLAVLGGDPTSTVIGLSLALGGGALAVVAWRRSAPIPSDARSGTWWKLALGGLGLIGLVIVASRAGVEAWFLGLATVLAGFVLIITGVLGGTFHAVRRLRGANHAA